MAYQSLGAQWHIVVPPLSQQPTRLRELELVGHLNSALGKIMLFCLNYLFLGNGIRSCPFLQCSKPHPSCSMAKPGLVSKEGSGDHRLYSEAAWLAVS